MIASAVDADPTAAVITITTIAARTTKTATLKPGPRLWSAVYPRDVCCVNSAMAATSIRFTVQRPFHQAFPLNSASPGATATDRLRDDTHLARPRAAPEHREQLS